MNSSRKKLSPVFLLIMMLLSMIGGAMCLNKVSPILSVIIDDMHLNGSVQGGLLISVFSVSGIILSIPIGVIMEKIGYYKTGLIALLAIVAGSVIGALEVSYPVMLFSRVIEGVGLIILTTAGPAVVTRSFTGSQLGSAMGLLMCFMTFGQIIMLNGAPRIAALGSWKNIWWFTAVYGVILFILWGVTLKKLDGQLDISFAKDQKTGLLPREVFCNPKMWCIGLTFMLYLIAQQGVIAFLPTYLSVERGISAEMAGSMTSIASFVGIPTGIVTGVLSDKIGSRKKLLVVLLSAAAVVYSTMPFFPTEIYGAAIALYGLAVMGIVGLCISTASELVEPQYGGMAVAFMNTMQWIGIFLSSTVFGLLTENFGYTGAFLILVPITFIAVALTASIKEI